MLCFDEDEGFFFFISQTPVSCCDLSTINEVLEGYMGWGGETRETQVEDKVVSDY